jgi:hypothetical protein
MREIPWKTFFVTYRWHWWVIFCNFGGNFNDVPPEVIAHLLLGIDIDYSLFFEPKEELLLNQLDIVHAVEFVEPGTAKA